MPSKLRSGRLLGVEFLEQRFLMAAGLRPAMASEGYLRLSDRWVGQERLGATEVNHPAGFGQRDDVLGFDYSSERVFVQTVIVAANDVNGNLVKPRHTVDGQGNSVVDVSSIVEDFETANAIYAQAGLTVRRYQPQNNSNVLVATFDGTQYPAVTYPLSFPDPTNPAVRDELRTITSAIRPPTGVINNFYVGSFEGPFVGESVPPHAPINAGTDDGIAVADPSHADTFPHELGHYLLGSTFEGTWEYNHFPGIDNGRHSTDLLNLMNRQPLEPNGGRIKGDGNESPREPGRPRGSLLGTLDHIDAEVFHDTNGNNTPDAAIPAEERISHLEGMLRSSFVQPPTVPTTGFGDYADFFWVETNHFLEGTRFDRLDSGVLGDELVFEIGALRGRPSNAHDVGHWLDAGQLSPLPAGAFTKSSFNTIDVLSNVARYSDMDIDTAGNWSRRASALDYKVWFAEESPIPNWLEGTPVANKLFDDGWSQNSKADDFVQRWRAPAGIQPGLVRIDHDEVAHDGNAQIDAVIAARLPRIAATGFNVKPSDSSHRTVQVYYQILDADLEELKVRIYTSPGFPEPGVPLKTVTITDPAMLSIGQHVLEITDIFSSFGDIKEDYYLVAVLDPDDDIEEYDEPEIQDNSRWFDGGVLYDPVHKIVQIHGWDGLGDNVELRPIAATQTDPARIEVKIQWVLQASFATADVNEIHVRLHEGNDSLLTGPLPYQFELPRLTVGVWGFGGVGGDILYGGDVTDSLFGGAGADYIAGSLGDDILFGEDGDDHMFGEDYYGPNPPTIHGSDSIDGGAGNDVVWADWGDDTGATATGGNDTLVASAGADELHGEGGTTTVRVPATLNDTVYDDLYLQPGTGNTVAISWEGGTTGVRAHMDGSLVTFSAAGNGQVAVGREGTIDTLTKTGSGTLDVTAMTSSGGPPRFYNNAGTTRFMADLASTASAGPTLNVNNASRVDLYSTQHLAALNVGASGVVYVAPSTAPNYKVLVVKALSIGTGGKLDITNNGMVIDYATIASTYWYSDQVRSWIMEGRNSTGLNGLWTGTGITSSTAATRNQTNYASRSVGYAINYEMPLGSYSTFMGQVVDPSSILIRYTVAADFTLDGSVNDNDVTVFGSYYDPGIGDQSWCFGDADYDGYVDNDDSTLLNIYYGTSLET